MIVWRVNYDLPWPEPVECIEFEYGERDALGATMYENTHYLDEAACWQSLLENNEAGQALAVVDLQQARSALARAMRRLADDAVRLTNSRLAHAEWKRGTLSRDAMPRVSRAWPTYAPSRAESALPPCEHCGNAYGLHGLATNHCPTWAEEGKR